MVDEIVNDVSIRTVTTKTDGSFSIGVQSKKSTLRFSDPDYQSYLTVERTFDLGQDCSEVSVYMSESSQE